LGKVPAKSNMLKGRKMFDVDRFVEECRAALGEGSPELAMKEVVQRAVSAPDELTRAFGQPDAIANIQPLYRSDDLTVMHFVWPPHMALFPHDHRMWAVIGVYGGREDNTFYKRRPTSAGVGLERVNGRTLESKDVVVLGEEVIHSVTNPLLQYTPAIHAYGGDFVAKPRSSWVSETSEEEPFSQDRLARAFAEARARPWTQAT